MQGRKLILTCAWRNRLKIKIKIRTVSGKRYKLLEIHQIIFYLPIYLVYTIVLEGKKAALSLPIKKNRQNRKILSWQNMKLVIKWEPKWLIGFSRFLKCINVKTKHYSLHTLSWISILVSVRGPYLFQNFTSLEWLVFLWHVNMSKYIR